jgi:hypothetical protein
MYVKVVMTGGEKRLLLALKVIDLTVLPADKDNATVVLSTTNYNWKIAALLENHAYRKLKDCTESV